MRLSETIERPTQAPAPAQQRLAEQERNRQRKAHLWKTTLSIGLLAMLAAAVVAGISLGRHLITHAANDPNPNCTLIVPARPLTAQGLATPYQLTATNPADGPCHEANPDQMAFVQGAIFDPATNQISIYNPLVIDKGSRPAIAPTVPQLPPNATVALWFGFNGDTLRLKGTNRGTLDTANCINGLGDSLFGQFAYCNAPEFFRLATQAIRTGKLKVPPLGTAKDGLPCPTVRDFSVVDQDQSDNVTTTYLVTQDGRIAQNTAANAAELGTAQVQVNGSDNRLLDVGIDGALGCTPWMAPDLADNGKPVPALPLNELQAAQYQKAPIALVPRGDPMVLVNGHPNRIKTNLYRLGVDQFTIVNERIENGDTNLYCKNLLQIAPARMQLDMPLTSTQPSPDPAAANNLFTFLAQRFNFTWGPDGINCAKLLNTPSPIATEQDANGVTISATINLNGGNGDGGGQATAPTCILNGTPVQGCAGTATLNGQTCTFAYDANTKQITITCQ